MTDRDESNIGEFKYRAVDRPTPEGVIKGWEVWDPDQGRWQFLDPADPRDDELVRECGLWRR